MELNYLLLSFFNFVKQTERHELCEPEERYLQSLNVGGGVGLFYYGLG